MLRHVIVYALTSPPRDTLDDMMKSWSPEKRADFGRDSDAKRDEYWAVPGSFRKFLTPWETAFAKTTMITMSAQQQIDATWRLESFQVLLWSLGLIGELPCFDVQASDDLLKGFPPEDPREFVANARLRPSNELQAARDLAELWHWRSRTRELLERGDPFPASPEMGQAGIRSYDDIVRLTARHAASDGKIPVAIDEDFPARGKAYRDLSADEWAEVRSITMERHHALNWLCGHAPSNRWDDTPTDT